MKDIAFDIKEREITFITQTDNTKTYKAVWGDLFDDDEGYAYMNIMLTSDDLIKIEGDMYGLIFNVEAPYFPNTSDVRIRFVVDADPLIKGDEFRTLSYFDNWDIAQTIKASQLILINKDGLYKICVKEDGAYIYSATQSDIELSKDCANQESQMLIMCNPGNLYRYPATGIMATKYINSIPEYTDIADVIVRQYEADNKSVSDAVFDAVTGDLNIMLANGDQGNSDISVEQTAGLDISSLKEEKKNFRQLIKGCIELAYNQKDGKLYSNIHSFEDILLLSDTLVGIDKQMHLQVDEEADKYFKLKLTSNGHLYRDII